MTSEDLLNYYYRKDVILLDSRKPAKLFKPEQLLGVRASKDVRHPLTNDLLAKKVVSLRVPPRNRSNLQALNKFLLHLRKSWLHLCARHFDPATKEVLIECNQEISGK
jgi:hypothetical protein